MSNSLSQNAQDDVKIYINDIGMVNALGSNPIQISENLFAGSQQGFVSRDDFIKEKVVYTAQVTQDLPPVDKYPQHFHSRNNQLALLAYQQIEDKVEALKTQFPEGRIGVILGTSTSGIAQGEIAMRDKQQTGQFPDEYDYRVQEMSNAAEFICHVANLSGFSTTISTACSSGAKSFITASELIHAGLLDAAIVGGVDSLCAMTVKGFSALESVSAGICNPSSKNRDGINIGEAAAFAILSKEKSKIRFYAGGESSDAHHMSAPHPQGNGAITSMNLALDKAGLAADKIDYVNLHGTATPKNDEMEAIAVSAVFPHQPFTSSSKGCIGHTLGAAGASELGLCVMVLENQRLAPHVWDKKIDTDIPPLNIANTADDHSKPIQFCLSNSFAFGGNNVSLIIGLENE